MSFKIGSLVKWKNITGYINFIHNEYITICLKPEMENSFSCCVLCYNSSWKDVIVQS